ncbi:MAG: hypothetical protein IT306_06405 [Chloroflexi bacterium]|nr:hypothetical protein [Chloroflexota bacterium]
MGDVEAASRLAVRLGRVQLDAAFVASQLGAQVREIVNHDLLAGAEVDRLGAVVALGGED